MTKREEILKYFEDNEDVFNSVIENLDSWNGYLGDDRYYDMYMLDEFYANTEPLELLNRVFYGYDADTTWTDERGEKHYGEFNPNREFFRYNGYGNLVSTDYKDYSDRIDEYFLDEVIDNRGNLWLDGDEFSDLVNLLNELETEESEE